MVLGQKIHEPCDAGRIRIFFSPPVPKPDSPFLESRHHRGLLFIALLLSGTNIFDEILSFYGTNHRRKNSLPISLHKSNGSKHAAEATLGLNYLLGLASAPAKDGSRLDTAPTIW